MVPVEPLSVDPSGEWSTRQAQAVLAIIQPQAERNGLRFRMVDVSTFSRRNRCILVARCLVHDVPVVEGHACAMCLRKVK